MNKYERIKHIAKSYAVLAAGLLVMAYGVAFSIKADLGTSPISSLPYVASMLVPLTVGQATIVMHCAFILIQIALLRREFKLIQLLQLPVALVFGYMIDFAMWSMTGFGYTSYFEQWALCALGIVLVGVGVSLEVAARAVVLAGEGVILAVSKVSGWKFSNVKIGFDTSLVVIASTLSLVFLDGLYGVREGTIAAAFLVGVVVKGVNKVLLKR